MKVLPTRDPNLFQVRTGGGLMLFGLPFLLTGLGLMALPFTRGVGAEGLATAP